MTEPRLCFFCGCSLASHALNGRGHVWREGPRVEPSDFARADERTQDIHRRFYKDQWRRRGVTVGPESP